MAGAPHLLTSFVGRDDELAEIVRLLSTERAVTLVGVGGVGKTRLAVEAATAFTDVDAAHFVNLARVGSDVPAALCQALRVAPVGEPTTEAIVRALDNQRVLLVLDNCEHVVDEVAAVVDAVLSRTSTVQFLITSRQPLHLTGEQLFPVPPLQVEDGVRLLIVRARRVAPALVVDDTAAFAALCRAVDGLPLAIELAAARLSALTPQEITEALDSGVELLHGARTDDDRHASVAACMQWSYDLLTQPEQRLLGALAILHCPFSAEAAVTLGGGSARSVLPTLVALVDRSLVSVLPGQGRTDYVLLEVVRRFALEQMTDPAEQQQARDRHLAWLVAEATATAPVFEGPRLEELVAQWAARVADIRAAISWAAERQRPDDALQLVGALWRFWWAGAKGEGGPLIAAALAIPGGSAMHRSRALVAATLAASARLDFFAAIDHAEQAVAAADESADAASRALSRCWLGWMRAVIDPTSAEPSLLEAVQLALAAGDDQVAADARNALAFLCVSSGQVAQGLSYVGDVLAATAVNGNRVTAAHALATRSMACLMLGRLDEAINDVALALPTARETNDAIYTVLLLAVRSIAHLLTGSDEIAADAADIRAVTSAMEPSILEGAAYVADGLVAIAACDLDAADQALSNAVFMPSVTVPPLRVLSISLLVSVRASRADLHGARAALDVGRSETKPGDDWATGRLNLSSARLSMAGGESAAAVEAAQSALQIAATLDDRLAAVDALLLLARLTLEQPRWRARALRVAAAAMAEADRLGYVFLPPDREVLDALRTTDSAARISFAAAIAEMRLGRGPRARPRTGWDSLTEAERRTVELVTTGRSNAEIAAELFVSRETVKGHVSAALRKLELKSRTELAAYAARRSASST